VIYLAFLWQHTTTQVIRVHRHGFAIPRPLPHKRQAFPGSHACMTQTLAQRYESRLNRITALSTRWTWPRKSHGTAPASVV